MVVLRPGARSGELQRARAYLWIAASPSGFCWCAKGGARGGARGGAEGGAVGGERRAFCGCPPPLLSRLPLNFLNSLRPSTSTMVAGNPSETAHGAAATERGCHPECPLLESSRYAQLALSLVLHSDAPGRRSQGSDGEHHRRAPRRNQLVCRDTATPSDRFEERCSRRKKVRSL